MFVNTSVPRMHFVCSTARLLLCYGRQRLASIAPAARYKDQCIENFDDPDVVSNGLPPPRPSPLCDVDVEAELTAVDVDVDD